MEVIISPSKNQKKLSSNQLNRSVKRDSQNQIAQSSMNVQVQKSMMLRNNFHLKFEEKIKRENTQNIDERIFDVQQKKSQQGHPKIQIEDSLGNSVSRGDLIYLLDFDCLREYKYYFPYNNITKVLEKLKNGKN